MKVHVLDAKDHLLGRMASICAKKILEGDKIIILRSESAILTGKLGRNVNKYKTIFKKKTNTNPRRGPFHFKSPSKIIWQTIKRMIPHKTIRGSDALKNLKVYDGIPRAFSKIKKQKYFEAFKHRVIKNYRNTVYLGSVCEILGWKNKKILDQANDKILAFNELIMFKKKKLKKIIRKKMLKIQKNNFIPTLILN